MNRERIWPSAELSPGLVLRMIFDDELDLFQDFLVQGYIKADGNHGTTGIMALAHHRSNRQSLLLDAFSPRRHKALPEFPHLLSVPYAIHEHFSCTLARHCAVDRVVAVEVGALVRFGDRPTRSTSL